MKREKEQKFTLRQHVRLVLRGLKVFSSFPQPVLLPSTISALFDAGVPFVNIYFSAQVINELAGGRDQSRLTLLVFLTIGLNLVFTLVKSLVTRWTAYCDTAMWTSISKVYTDKFLSMDYIDVEDPAVQQEFSEIRQHHNGMGFGLSRLIHSYNQIIIGLIRIVLSVAMAFSLFTLRVPAGSAYEYLDSPLFMVLVAAALCGSILLAPYLYVVGGRIWSKASHDNNKSNRLFSFYFFGMISGSARAKDIRIYDQQRLIADGTNGFNAIGLWQSYARYSAKYGAAGTAVTHLSNGLIYLYIALKALAGAFGVGGIVQYVGAVTQFGSGFSGVLMHIGNLVNNNVFLDKAFRFLDIPNRKYQGTLSVEKRDDYEYEIEFRDVSFQYPGTDASALKNLNLKFTVGRRMAVVGMNGSGKTTMIKLLCRLYDPTEGEITLNGIDIKKYDYAEYLRLFSVVFQDFKLLSLPLGQNVAASAAFDAEKAAACLAQAGFGPRLAALPRGLDTCLYRDFDEDGVEVSGGEAQKIALARALYKDAPFLVLDEPTAALDPIAEYEIYSKFDGIVGGKTAVYISHRLSSCRFCDDIAVFHEGRLIQRGGHEALLSNREGTYYELWHAQAQYNQEKAAVEA